MTVNPVTNAVRLTPDEVRKAIALYLQQKTFSIHCTPDSVHYDSMGAEVIDWNNEPPDEREEMFLVNP